MRNLIILCGLFGSLTASAAVTSRGYSAKLEETAYLYLGLTDDDQDVQMGFDRFTSAQIETVNKCVTMKDTHAVEVVSETRYPHSAIQSVKCVEAPGFYKHWKKEYFENNDDWL